MKYLRLLSIIMLFFLLIVSPGCSTKKNTFLSRNYHNLTSYYNVYYNAKEAYREGINTIDKSYKENYSLILPIYKYSNKEASRAAMANMNRAVEKCSKCVRKHSITAKPKKDKRSKYKGKKKQEYEDFYNQKEFVAFIDNAYLLMGKAHLLKHDYFPAMEAFNFIIQEYSDKPVKYDGYLWLARTYVEMMKYDQAREILGRLESNKFTLPEHLPGEIAMSYADINIREKRYEEAIPYLEKAIESVSKKKEKARLYFILAQLYKQNKQFAKAFDIFGLCIDHNPDYEMVFNARINRASIFNSNSGSSENLQRELTKMLRDEKNYEYRDQIYYALGNIAYNEDRDADAIKFYKESTIVSTDNQNQKAISFLALADLYFEDPDYRNAQMYYDSSVVILDINYPNYQQIKRKSENLNDLVLNLTAIEEQDSLQRVAKMPEAQRLQFIDKLIAQVLDEERKAKEAEALQQRDLLNMQQQNRELQSGEAKWYLYNPSMLGSGAAEFKKKWGSRKLEDNWRRKNKQVMEWDNYDNDTEKSDSAQVYDIKSREYYLINLPLTDSAIQKSQLSIETSYLNIAGIYKDKFLDYPLAIDGYLDLLKRFPETNYKPQVWYNLYRLYYLRQDYKEAEKYKESIIREFPESDYAKILNNPDYFKELEAVEEQVKFIYGATYKYFVAGNYEKVDYNVRFVDSAYKDSKLRPKFALLSTLCVGAKRDTIAFQKALTNFIAKYPSSDEAAYATDVIEALGRKQREVLLAKKEAEGAFSTELSNSKNDSIDISIYSNKEDQPFLYLSIVAVQKASPNIIKFNLSNFNIDYYSFLDFEVETEFISADFTAVVVKSFKNAAMASNYLESVYNVETPFDGIDQAGYRNYIISEENYKKLIESKNLKGYTRFYDLNYKN